MKIILVRHGETAWNKEQVFRGRKDLELNANGLFQAESTGKYLSGEKVDAIYSSPLKRALSTAEEIIRHHNLPVKPAEELIDFNFGVWEGLEHRQVKEKYPDQYNIWQTEPVKVRIPGGETFADIESRVRKLLGRLVKEHPGQTVIVVSHRVILKVIVLTAIEIGVEHFWAIRLDPCSVSVLEYSPRKEFILTQLNGVTHLADRRNQVDF